MINPLYTDLNQSIIKQDLTKPTEEEKPSLTHRITHAFWTGMGIWATYNLVDSGLSRVLALETLTHGTGLFGYIGINLNGADPNYGGSHLGSSAAINSQLYMKNSKNYFHVFKDSEMTEACNTTKVPLLCNAYLNELLPRLHAILAGAGNLSNNSYETTLDFIKAGTGAMTGFLTPTLKFRFKQADVLNCKDSCIFENDPDYSKAAYKTSIPIPPTHLGILGSLSQGIHSNTLYDMAAQPDKVLVGVLLLGTAILIGKKTYEYYHTPIKQESASPATTSLECFKKNAKAVAVTSCWATMALTTIFLNTL